MELEDMKDCANFILYISAACCHLSLMTTGTCPKSPDPIRQLLSRRPLAERRGCCIAAVKNILASEALAGGMGQ
jgi:hypothetical protein